MSAKSIQIIGGSNQSVRVTMQNAQHMLDFCRRQADSWKREIDDMRANGWRIDEDRQWKAALWASNVGMIEDFTRENS